MEESSKYLANIFFAIGFGFMYPLSSICIKAIVDEEIKFGSPFVAFLSCLLGFVFLLAGFFYLQYQEFNKKLTSSQARSAQESPNHYE